MRQAAAELALDSFLDPRGKLRFPVYSFKPTAADPDLREMIAGYERLNLDEIYAVLGITAQRFKRRLGEAGLSHKGLVWRDVRGLWDLPETYSRSSTNGSRRQSTSRSATQANAGAAAKRAAAASRMPGSACATV